MRVLRVLVWATLVVGSARAGEVGAPPFATAPDGASALLRDSPLVASTPAPYCPGEYADDFVALSRPARDFDEKAPPYTYCVRTTAVYECPSYSADGSLRRTRRKVVAHGTAFAYRQDGGETLLLTNEHVAEWPAVTDADHAVEDVPAGCRRVAQELRIVDDESDAYDRDDIPLTSVAVDPQLDVAVLRARTALNVMPWRVGHSAGLRERNVVDVRGFPLGVLRANNVGKVVSALDHDEQREWDHDDFVIDALLSHGNSGSPVLAISCRTGEFELVGIYHAGYEAGSALNVVVGIDQVRDLMTTLRRVPRPEHSPAPIAASERHALYDFVAAGPGPSFFAVGSLVGAVHARADGALVYVVMGRDFPLDPGPRLVVEDLPPRTASSFGTLGRLWAGDRQGLRDVDHASLDAETLGQVSRMLDAFRRDAMSSMAYARALRRGIPSREQFRELSRLERDLRRTAAAQQDLSQSALDLAERLCPPAADAPSTLAVALLPPPSPGDDRATSGDAPRPWRLDLLHATAGPALLLAPRAMLGPLD